MVPGRTQGHFCNLVGCCTLGKDGAGARLLRNTMTNESNMCHSTACTLSHWQKSGFFPFIGESQPEQKHMCKWMCLWVCLCGYVGIHAKLHMWMSVCVSVLRAYVVIHAKWHMWSSECVSVFVWICVYTHQVTHVDISVCKCVCAHMWVYTPSYTCGHQRIHLQELGCSFYCVSPGIEPRSSGLMASVFTCWAVLPVQE